jgi:pimeloyl-ACP methyl ester carboxylesterase
MQSGSSARWRSRPVIASATRPKPSGWVSGKLRYTEAQQADILTHFIAGGTASAAGIMAVVSRGGCPGLAYPRLAAVSTPTLLIVTGHDDVVLHLSRRARKELHCENDLAMVPGASHLFEEPCGLALAVLQRHNR